jgi:methanogenic corrinoid protein MtbC1
MTGFGQEVAGWSCFEGGDDDDASDRSHVARTRGVPHCEGSGDRLAKLVRTIEDEIIPRLVLARRAAPGAPAIPALVSRLPSAADVADFTQLILANDVAVAASYVEALRARGTALETVFLELLAPCARRLGELWKADVCDFAQVTVGLWRLHQLLRELSPTFRDETEHQSLGRRVVLAPAPGEQHMFGICIVAEFFRRAGWDVWGGPPAAGGDLLGIVRSESFAVVGLSLSAEARLDGLAARIREIRRASRNRAIRVMVGGQVFNERPQLVALVGADATAADGRQAPQQAKNLLALLAQRSSGARE